MAMMISRKHFYFFVLHACIRVPCFSWLFSGRLKDNKQVTEAEKLQLHLAYSTHHNHSIILVIFFYSPSLHTQNNDNHTVQLIAIRHLLKVSLKRNCRAGKRIQHFLFSTCTIHGLPTITVFTRYESWNQVKSRR